MTANQEIADRLATAAGWVAGDGVWFNAKGEWPNHGYESHPFPVGDVNALLTAWPEGWGWERHGGWWKTKKYPATFGGLFVTIDTGNIWHDLALLTAKVLEWEAGHG